MKGSDLFVQALEAEGVEHIFGLPGEENADLMISLLDSRIQFILCRHEQAAAFMADAYGRLTGRAGVCLATLGPGATNLVTGIADAHLDRSPVVAIVGQADTWRLHKESHQNMDTVSMYRPITKWAQTVMRSESVPEIVRKAFKIAEAEKPGPCLVELPEDVAASEAFGQAIVPDKVRRPAADWMAVDAAVEMILQAENPIILAGNGAVRKHCARQLRRLARKTGIPVINTFMGKGAVPRGDQHCLFTIGLQGGDHANLAIDQADLVIAVGYDLVEYAPHAWNRSGNKKVLHIDFAPAEVDRDYPVEVELVADVGASLWQVNEALNKACGDARLPLHDIGRWAALRQTILDDFAMEKDDAAFPMKPQKILWEVRDFLGPSDILLSDVGAHKMWVARYYQCDEPNTCLISNGFCSMGFALPGAIGAKFARPKSRVLAVCGDAGVMMNIHDLETAARLKLNIVVMVWLDGEYGLIKWKQQNHFDGRHSDLAFNNPDFELLAKAFGCWGKTISSPEELVPALEEAFLQPGPAIVAVPVEYGENRKLTKRLGELTLRI